MRSIGDTLALLVRDH